MGRGRDTVAASFCVDRAAGVCLSLSKGHADVHALGPQAVNTSLFLSLGRPQTCVGTSPNKKARDQPPSLRLIVATMILNRLGPEQNTKGGWNRSFALLPK